MNNESSPNDFLFVKSVVKSKIMKKSTYGTEGNIIDYQPWEDEEEEWVKKPIREQIRTTVSNVRAMKLKDEERVYVAIGLSSSYTPHKTKRPINIHVFNDDVKKVINCLSAKFLAYLNTEHNRILVSCSLSNLAKVSEIRKGCNSKYFRNVKRLSTLTYAERVSEHLRQDTEWKTTVRPILIQLIPNLPKEIEEQYSAKIIEHLMKIGREPIDINLDLIVANLNKEATTELLETSNFVFHVSEVPQGVAQRLKTRKQKRKPTVNSKFIVESKASSMENERPVIRGLPVICLMDSGVSDIPKLSGLIIQKDGYHFRDLTDGAKDDGHGTPIACLAIFGEELSQPKARIISYKIFAEDQKNLDLRAYQQAIANYSNQTRIFLSSINFKRQSPYITSELEHLVQASNICMIISAGNIRDKQRILDYAFEGTPCSIYVPNYPVEDPASAVTIMAAGAISKKQAPNSISHENELAPFTVCGVTNSSLHDCPKPEVVQNGGNYCKDNTYLGLESYNKSGTKINTFIGTSFSSPLLARNITEIEAKYGQPYGGKIQNVETLKAIALTSANPANHVCMGFGETRPFSACDDEHALVYSEGEIPLDDRVSDKGFHTESRGVIKIKVPTGVCCIEMFIVHSDNNYLTTVPCLNTYLKVYAHKEGNETAAVTLSNPAELYKKAHMKVFRWAFSRTSMQGKWTFTIIPEPTVDMLPEHQKNTKVRYGCAIVLTSRTSHSRSFMSLTERLRLNNRSL